MKMNLRPSISRAKALLREEGFELKDFFVCLVEEEYRDYNMEKPITLHNILLIAKDEGRADDFIGFTVEIYTHKGEWHVGLQVVDDTRWRFNFTKIVEEYGWGRRGLLAALAA